MSIVNEVREKEQYLKQTYKYRYLWLKLVMAVENSIFVGTPLSRKCECSFTEIAHFDHNIEFDIEDYPCTNFKTDVNTFYIWLKEIKGVGLLNWLWFVVRLNRNEFHSSLDFNYGKNYTKVCRNRERAHIIDSLIEDIRYKDLKL